MQTGVQTFNLQIQGATPEIRGCAGACARKSQDPAGGPFADFMEIMSALMALPPEQWKDSLAELETGLADGASSPAEDKSGVDQLDAQQFDLMGFFLNLPNAVQKELADAQEPDKAHALLDIAKALMDDPEMPGTAADQSALEALKAKWLQLYNRNRPNDLAGFAKEAEAPDMSAVVQSAQNPIPEEESIKAAKNPDSLSDNLTLAADTKPAAVDAAAAETPPLEDLAKKLSQKHLNSKVDASHSGAHRTESPAGPVNGFKGQQPLDLDLAAASTTDTTAHEPQQSDSESDDGFSDLPGSTAGKPDNLEAQSLFKPSGLSGASQGLLSRLEPGTDPGAVHSAGQREVMPQDKALQSDVIRQIVQRMSLHTQGGQSKMVIHLKPEYLGNVHMQVLTENHQVTVRMMADSLNVKEIVEQNIQHLRTELQHHGLEIQKFDVFVASDSESWQNRQEQAGFKQFQRQRRQRYESGKVKLESAEPPAAGATRKSFSQTDLNEIDYFA